ncbi:hypothetical protein [Streptomyces sp. NPDC059278]|uniref:hypothetical protein n=1 Tax=Streptomyces sp. NPDC059278 TaxID=3346801 RepID=UPI0036954527
MPVRIEIGPRDLASGTATPARRIPGGKEPVPVEARLAEHGVSVRCLVAGDGSVPGADD